VETVAPPAPKVMPKGPVVTAQTTSLAVGRPAGTGPELAPPPSRPPERPFDLSARLVEATVLRSPVKSTVDTLECEGFVKVHQEGAKPEEKGTDIEGHTLKMTLEEEGAYYLVVTGDLAKLETDKITIFGPEVNINQATNKAWVYGDGLMRMESETNFQGDKLEKPVPLNVLWSKSMLFNGGSAEFEGNVQAEQQNSRLACLHLQVLFDRIVSLKQGNKSDQPARVRKLVCDKEVRVEDYLYEDGTNTNLKRYTLLEAPAMNMDALEPDDPSPAKAKGGNKVIASGPGLFKVWQPGNEDVTLSTEPKTETKRPVDEDQDKPAQKKLTCVWFERRMDANSHTNTAWFWQKVRVLSLPSERHDRVVDLEVILADDLPEDTLYLTCDRLQVLDRPSPDDKNKTNKQMEGHGHVYVQGREFWARGEAVYYNEAKRQVILDGKDGWAKLSRVTRQGAPPETVEGKKIIYNQPYNGKGGKVEGKLNVINARQVQGQSLPSRR
jgi:hypothetical protein